MNRFFHAAIFFTVFFLFMSHLCHTEEVFFLGDGGRDIRIAVVEPVGTGLYESNQWMLSHIQNSIIGDLGRFTAMTIIDGQRLDTILAIQALSLSGHFSEDDYISIGRLAHTSHILTATINRTPNAYWFELAVTEVETGTRLATTPPASVLLSGLEDLSAVREALSFLLARMGIRLTRAGQNELKRPAEINRHHADTAIYTPPPPSAPAAPTQPAPAPPEETQATETASLRLVSGLDTRTQRDAKAANARNNWISADISVFGFGLRYERMLGPKVSLGTYVYTGGYWWLGEEFSTFGVDAALRWYPWGKTFFMGAALGYYYYYHYYYNYSSYSSYSGATITPEIGWRIDVGNAGGFYIQFGVAAVLPLGVYGTWFGWPPLVAKTFYFGMGVAF